MINWILLVVKKIRDPKSLANRPEVQHLLLQSLLQAGHSGCISSACAWLYVKCTCSSSGLVYFYRDSVCRACQTRQRQYTQQVKCIFFSPCELSFPFSPSLPPSLSISHFLELPMGGRKITPSYLYITIKGKLHVNRHGLGMQEQRCLCWIQTRELAAAAQHTGIQCVQPIRVRKGARRNPPETLQSQYKRQQQQQTRANPGIRLNWKLLGLLVFILLEIPPIFFKTLLWGVFRTVSCPDMFWFHYFPGLSTMYFSKMSKISHTNIYDGELIFDIVLLHTFPMIIFRQDRWSIKPLIMTGIRPR